MAQVSVYAVPAGRVPAGPWRRHPTIPAMPQDPSTPHTCFLGRRPYEETYEAMRRFTAERQPDTPDEIWLVEHPPVFTQGLAGRAEHLLAPRDIPVVSANRGGQVTYHGPGQVVAYPLVDLRRLGFFVKEYVFRLEAAAIQTLEAW